MFQRIFITLIYIYIYIYERTSKRFWISNVSTRTPTHIQVSTRLVSTSIAHDGVHNLFDYTNLLFFIVLLSKNGEVNLNSATKLYELDCFHTFCVLYSRRLPIVRCRRKITLFVSYFIRAHSSSPASLLCISHNVFDGSFPLGSILARSPCEFLSPLTFAPASFLVLQLKHTQTRIHRCSLTQLCLAVAIHVRVLFIFAIFTWARCLGLFFLHRPCVQVLLNDNRERSGLCWVEKPARQTTFSPRTHTNHVYIEQRKDLQYNYN